MEEGGQLVLQEQVKPPEKVQHPTIPHFFILINYQNSE